MNSETLAPVLRVQNVDAAIAWYQRLGFDMEFQHSSGPGLSHARAVVKRGDLLLILSNRDEEAPGSSAVVHLRVGDVEPIAAAFQVPIQGLQGGALIGRQVELCDPDGNRIHVVELAPAPALWP